MSDGPFHNRRVLNCGDDGLPGPRLVRDCPKTWADLEATDTPRTRYCDHCDHLVHRVANRAEARVRAREQECIAVPPSVYDRAKEIDENRGLTIGLFLEGAFIDRHLPE